MKKNYNNLTLARKQMVENQLIPLGIKHSSVLSSMGDVPRHIFVPEEYQEYAYDDTPLPIAEGQTISQPYIVALMVQALKPVSSDKILEIGTGSGYAAAVLSRIVGEVFTIERHDSLAKQAKSRFQQLKYENIHVLTGDGTKGWPEEAPFDGILVSAGAPATPNILCSQLKPEGRLLIPVGDREHQELLLVERDKDGNFSSKQIGLVRFVPLVGEEGWDENRNDLEY